LLDYLLFPGLRRVVIDQPVFIIGNARSGTTLFHRLLCGDKRFVYFRMWEMLFPSLLQRKVLSSFFTVLDRLCPRQLERLVAWEARQFPEFKAQHMMTYNTPEEDEFLFLIPFSSAMLNVFFPYATELRHLGNFELRSSAARKRIMRYYINCVKRQLYGHGRHVTLLSKNPAFVSKMHSLPTTFPDAKFIYLVRNPFETIPSLLKLFHTMWQNMGTDSKDMVVEMQEFVDGCIRDYYYALEVLDNLPPERYTIIKYDDLVADPKAVVEQAYERLQMPITPEFEQQLSSECKRQVKYRSDNVYSLDQFGVNSEDLAERLAPIMERFGFQDAVGPADQTVEVL
jgi:hypothetical protein